MPGRTTSAPLVASTSTQQRHRRKRGVENRAEALTQRVGRRRLVLNRRPQLSRTSPRVTLPSKLAQRAGSQPRHSPSQKAANASPAPVLCQKMKGAAAAPGARAHRQTTATPFLSSLKRITGPSPPSQTAAEGTLPRSYLIILDCAPKRKGKGEWVLFWTELWYNSR